MRVEGGRVTLALWDVISFGLQNCSQEELEDTSQNICWKYNKDLSLFQIDDRRRHRVQGRYNRVRSDGHLWRPERWVHPDEPFA